MIREDAPKEEKMSRIWGCLYASVVAMKREFHEFMKMLDDGREVAPYCERAQKAPEPASHVT